MQRVKIITDTASDMPQEYIDKYNISLLPMGVVINDKTYIDRLELDAKSFYKMMREDTKALPKTTMPAVEKIKEEFMRNLDVFEHQIYVCISSKGSGTYNVANMVKSEIEEELQRLSNITVVDSLSFSAGYGYAVGEMAKAAHSGADYDTVMAVYRDVMDNIGIGLVLEDLMHLQRGGRIKPTTAIVGGLLGIKPLVTINDGLLENFGKERGKKRGMKKIVDMMLEKMDPKDGAEIWIVHADADDEVEIFKKMITEVVQPEKFVVCELGACVGTHTGQGLIGMIYRTAPASVGFLQSGDNL